MSQLGQDLNNDQKAEVFELTVSIHNNLSICLSKLKEYGYVLFCTQSLNPFRNIVLLF
jgi:hypothetical protein